MASGIENIGARLTPQNPVLQQRALEQQALKQQMLQGSHNNAIIPSAVTASSSSHSLQDKDTSGTLADYVDLSQEAMATLFADSGTDNNRVNTLEKGRGESAQQALDSLGNQFQQIKNAVSALNSLLDTDTGDNRDIIIKTIEEQTRTLTSLGQQLGLMAADNGDPASQTEGQFFIASSSARSAAIPQHEMADIYKDPIGAIQAKYLPPYKEAGLQIEQLVKEFESRFSDEEQFPPSIFNQIKRLVSSAKNAENISRSV